MFITMHEFQCVHDANVGGRHPRWSLQLASCSTCQNKLSSCSSAHLHVLLVSPLC
uniref:Uncharacterized protein n=1 Tax=Setaria italica TaxID=4555 RepID=K3XU39_SETIT